MFLRNSCKSIIIVTVLFALVSCAKDSQERADKVIVALASVDALDTAIKSKVANYDWQISLDHHRMALEEDAYTPPAIATIFSDSETNSRILETNTQLVALDLPFKVLAYSEPDAVDAKLAYTSVEFIARRHNLPASTLVDYSVKLNSVLSLVDKSIISETRVDEIEKDFAVVKIKSDFDFDTTLRKLKKTINSIPDTVFFGELDYKKEADEFGVELNPTTLLFFGAPEPGAKAMIHTPKLGLDAFCQKLLVLKNDKSEVWVAYNDITAFSNLYYGKTTVPQRLIKHRLKDTLSTTLEKQ